jgi:orotidine-5'-phosphate decarboxylase
MEHFADRLLLEIEKKGTPLVVGLDPVFESLPAAIKEDSNFNDPNDAQAASDALLEFCTKVLKVVSPHVAAVKINSAFFESYLEPGLEAYHAVIQEAAASGVLVIGDVKRGDIGNTAKHYAQASLADPQFDGVDDLVGPDAVTINSYMGGDTAEPFITVAREYGKGLFALVRTSNPGAAAIQDMKLENGEPLYLHVGKLVAKWGEKDIGKRGYSLLGAVVGATNAQQLADLRAALPSVLFLVPGLGAQGGTASDAAKAFKSDGTGAIINSSRGIIFAFNDAKYKDAASWEKAIELSTLETKRQINEALGR